MANYSSLPSTPRQIERWPLRRVTLNGSRRSANDGADDVGDVRPLLRFLALSAGMIGVVWARKSLNGIPTIGHGAGVGPRSPTGRDRRVPLGEGAAIGTPLIFASL